MNTAIVPPTTPQLQYEFGFTAYCDRVAIDDLDNEHQRRGWMAALAAQAEAEAYADDIADRDYWRRGQW